MGLPTPGYQIRAALTLFLFFLSYPISGTQTLAAPSQTLIAETAQNQSKQFFVQSLDRSLRFDSINFADQLLAVWQTQIGPPNTWESPIWIVFPDESRKKNRQLAQINYLFGDGNSLRIQLSIFDPKTIGSPELAEWFFHALIGELASRSTPPTVNKAYRTPPPWLTQALVQQWLSKKTPPPTFLLEGILNAPKPPTLSSIINQKSSIGSVTDATVFRLLSLGILRTLQDQPNGPACFRNLCSLLGERDLDTDAILKTFPSFGGSAEKLERQWTLSLARLASAKRTDLLSFSETFKQLDRCLAIRTETTLRNKEKKELFGIQAIPEIAKQQGGPLTLANLAASLMQLETRSHPLATPLIRELRDLILITARKPKTNLDKKFEKTSELLSLLRKTGSSINDAMNTCEVNLKGPSDSHFQLMFQTQQDAFSPEPRRDAISRSLDAHESELNGF